MKEITTFVFSSVLLINGLFLFCFADDDLHMPFERKEEFESRKRSESVPKAGYVPSEIEAKFLNGDYSGVIGDLRNLPGGRRSKGEDALLYLRGRSYLKLGEFEKARADFGEIISRYRRSEILDRVMLSMADAYFEEGNTQAAMEGYEKVIRDFPPSRILNIALFQLAKCYLHKGKWQNGKDALKELTLTYPSSFEGQQANAILKNNEFFFTIQVGSYKYEVNANEAKDALKKKGYNAYISKGIIEGRELYRVRVGKFDTFNEAQKIQEKLRKEGLVCVIFP
ncbi:MAG: tetratricopeptide repeat protein [Candidatus Omnitrophica bacterium]|nr:tetratricopeptide repeat protein [Candidatus Omnitrophota bacterium]